MPEILVPCKAFNERVAFLVKQDVLWLAREDNAVLLIDAPFTPDPALRLEDLSFAPNEIFGNVTMGASPMELIRDMDTGGMGVYFSPTSVNFIMQPAEAPTPPLTIYGYAITNDDQSTLIATAKFTEPIVIQRVYEYVRISQIFGFLPPQPFNAE